MALNSSLGDPGAPSSLPPSGAAGGDLGGTYPNPTVTKLPVTVTLAADATNATAAMANTLLSAALAAAGVYHIHLALRPQTDVDADGFKVDLDGGAATATAITAFWRYEDTAGAVSQFSSTALATDFAIGIADNTAQHLMTAEITITVNAGGTFIVRFAQNAHSTGTASMLRGSAMTVFPQ